MSPLGIRTLKVLVPKAESQDCTPGKDQGQLGTARLCKKVQPSKGGHDSHPSHKGQEERVYVRWPDSKAVQELPLPFRPLSVCTGDCPERMPSQGCVQ